jgi:hypothetical protein
MLFTKCYSGEELKDDGMYKNERNENLQDFNKETILNLKK